MASIFYRKGSRVILPSICLLIPYWIRGDRPASSISHTFCTVFFLWLCAIFSAIKYKFLFYLLIHGYIFNYF